MLRLSNISIPASDSEQQKKQLEKKLKALWNGSLPEYRIVRRSLDARKKTDIRFIYTVDVKAEEGNEKNWIQRHKGLQAESCTVKPYELPSCGPQPLSERPVVVGAGPAGLFAALLLAEKGFRPLLLEQGEPVEIRSRDVEDFWQGGKLKHWSNVQFGEGGAGTFSDGKLNTGIKDPSGRIPFVLETFVRFGAAPAVLYDAKPHIGTDVLKTVVRGIREEILRLGGEICFHSRMSDLCLEKGCVSGVIVTDTHSGEQKTLKTELLLLAPGHSSRETFELLLKKGVSMERKAFAVGVRIQHPQKQINEIQYGPEAPKGLPAADYKLTARAEDGRGVYSFCMCPGGTVVNASSEEGRLCVNGMSEAARDGENANSALIVQVEPGDFEGEDVLSGVAFQRKWEEANFRAAEGRIPLQRWDDFVAGQKTRRLGAVRPQVGGEWAFADLNETLPPFVIRALKEAMPQFDRRMKGFERADALLAGMEARTSSPIRIVRSDRGESSVPGLYPMGEGAGYAGGITSAAVDGMKTAEEIIRRYTPDIRE